MLALRTIVCGLLLSATALAAPPVRLGVELVDGSSLRGKISTDSVFVRAVVGQLDIPWSAIAAIDFNGDREGFTARLRNGNVLNGPTGLALLDLQTIVGMVKISTAQSSRITVLGAVPPDGKLVFWNTLGSKDEIYHSKVGPGGTYKGEGGRFEKGKFGGALVVAHIEMGMVSFPVRDVISPQAGCIALWVKLIDFPKELAWGENLALFEAMDSKTTFDGELVLMTQQHLHQGSIACDDIKVWNYAKTDISDRFGEEGGE